MAWSLFGCLGGVIGCVGTGAILPELRQGPWDMEATGVLGLAHKQDEGDEGNGGCGMGVLGRGDPSAERAN